MTREEFEFKKDVIESIMEAKGKHLRFIDRINIVLYVKDKIDYDELIKRVFKK